MSEPLLTGTVAFIQHHLPALKAGEYKVLVQQEVETADHKITDRFVSQMKFAVAGNRFQLDDSEIDSVFPPLNSQGEFSNVLPHLVLKRRTFPWERSPAPAGALIGNSVDDVPTWLALLLIDTADGVAPARTLTVANLVSASKHPGGTLPDHFVSYPDLASLDYGEEYAHPCQVIDVPVALFNAIAPSFDDLKWLAHARRVDTAKKPSSEPTIFARAALAGAASPPSNGSAAGGGTPNGSTPEVTDYAVVVGNRLPVPGHKSTVHLVSLDHFREFLPGPDGRQNPDVPVGTQYVRLVSLKSWSFDTVDEKQSFQAILEAVTVDELQLPGAAKTTANTSADATAKNALAMGFTALNHRPRQGGRTVSWYRGPLVPFPVARTVQTPIESADAATQYDPTTGLLDVSYAAAWQLGRVMALQNQEFAAALFAWKLANKRETIAQAEQQLLKRRIAGGDDAAPADVPAVHDAALDLLKSGLNGIATPSPPPKAGP
jgi:hypothetical protein